MLDSARTALAGGDAEAATRRLDAFARSFPNGGRVLPLTDSGATGASDAALDAKTASDASDASDGDNAVGENGAIVHRTGK